MSDPSLSEHEQEILDNVVEHGWHCVAVFGEGERPGFAYSVGFIDTLKCPEFIVFGLDTKLMHGMLWSVFRQVRDGKAMPGEGQRWCALIEGYDCISRAVHPSQIEPEYFNSALWYWWYSGRERESVCAYQLFWPGREQGLFPWESGCNQIVRDYQPALYLPDETGLA